MWFSLKTIKVAKQFLKESKCLMSGVENSSHQQANK
jgi:hypothetical protein